MLGTTVLIPSSLVPQMGGGNKAQVIQTLLFGSRLPAVIGGSYTFVPETISIIHAGRFNDEPDPKEVLYGSGSSFKVIIIFAIMMSQILKRFCMRTRICVEIVLPEIIILVVFSQYIPHMIKGQPGALKLPHTQGPGRGPTILVYCTQPHMMKGEKSIFDRFAVMFSVAIVWFYAYILIIGGAYKNSAPKTQTTCRTDSAGIIGGAPWIRVPYPFQWGAPTFDAAEIFAMMAASLVALVESTGAFIAVSRYSSATPNPPSVLSRGVGWQGVGIMLSGIFGTGNGSSVSVENAGLLALTRVGSRRVVQISSGFMIFFSILGKVKNE